MAPYFEVEEPIYANPLRQGASKQIPIPLVLTWSPTPGNAGTLLYEQGC